MHMSDVNICARRIIDSDVAIVVAERVITRRERPKNNLQVNLRIDSSCSLKRNKFIWLNGIKEEGSRPSRAPFFGLSTSARGVARTL